MFQIKNCAANITSVNPRKENHGTENEPAFDINFNMTVYAECVKGLYSEDFIRAMWKPDGKALTVIGITNIVLDKQFVNGIVKIKEGTGHETVFAGCKLKSFKLLPKEFQMIQVSFQVQYASMDEEEIVPAYRCLKATGIQVSMDAETPDQQPKKKEEQIDAFPNGEPEVEEEDPFEGSDLVKNFSEESFEDFPKT